MTTARRSTRESLPGVARRVRFPEPIDREVAARAKAAGMSWSDVAAALIAFALGGDALTKKEASQ